jgi:hypothetical protein
MRKTLTLITLTAVAILVAFANRLSAFTDTIQVHDDVIFIDGNEPNTPQLGDLSSPCPQIAADMRPALLFIDGKPLDERLYVACFPGGAVQKEELARAKYLQVTQLDHATFLVGTSGGSTDRGVFVLDLDRGISKQLARSTRIHCLRSVPERGKAMLIHCDLSVGEVRYLELDLDTLRLTLSHTFKEADLGGKFIGVWPDTTLSPDFQQVAYMDAFGDSWPPCEYRLMLLNLSTMQERCVDDRVGVLFSPVSSSLDGTPPLDWINANEIVYQDMPVPDPNDPYSLFEALCVFKRADVATGSISEVLRETLRLGVGAGSLWLNPLNGELLYNGQWVLHLDEGKFTSAIDPFSFEKERDSDCTKVYLGEQLLQTADGMVASALISALHQDFAYVLWSAYTDPSDTVYVKLPAVAKPIEVAKGSRPTTPVGWVE